MFSFQILYWDFFVATVVPAQTPVTPSENTNEQPSAKEELSAVGRLGKELPDETGGEVVDVPPTGSSMKSSLEKEEDKGKESEKVPAENKGDYYSIF